MRGEEQLKNLPYPSRERGGWQDWESGKAARLEEEEAG